MLKIEKHLLFFHAAVGLVAWFAAPAHASVNCPDTYRGFVRGPLRPLSEEDRVRQRLAAIKARVAYPNVPDVDQIALPQMSPRAVRAETHLSAGLADPILERARNAQAFADFKPLSDARPRSLSLEEKNEIEAAARKLAEAAKEAERERVYLRAYIERAYDFGSEVAPVQGLDQPRLALLSDDPQIDALFAHTERTWSDLLRETRAQAGGSLLDLPYPMLVPGGRFTETYYWDAYFGIKGLLSTGRTELAQMQVENMLSLVRRFGFVPNGNRDYYLTRSQPPFLSRMVREVYEASLAEARTPQEKARVQRWLRERAYPLVRHEYQDFWMNPNTRFDPTTGLNHHWDDANLPRPERHGFDNESELGRSYRHVRCAAESGLDFTAAHQGEACNHAPVLLNSLLFQTEQDLAWMARELGMPETAQSFTAAAASRANTMHRLLWNPAAGRFENYDLERRRRVPALIADTFAPLFTGWANPAQARQVSERVLPVLEGPGGIRASSNLQSTHQWDGNNGWAPHQVMAVEGLARYGHQEQARRIALSWVQANARVHQQTETVLERVNVETRAAPRNDGTKYETQAGFLWTNGSIVWMIQNVLGIRSKPISPSQIRTTTLAPVAH